MKNIPPYLCLVQAVTTMSVIAGTSASWTGNTSNQWSLASNWSPSTIPTDEATLGASGANSIELGNPTSIERIRFNNDGTWALSGSPLIISGEDIGSSAARPLAIHGPVSVHFDQNVQFTQSASPGKGTMDIQSGASGAEIFFDAGIQGNPNTPDFAFRTLGRTLSGAPAEVTIDTSLTDIHSLGWHTGNSILNLLAASSVTQQTSIDASGDVALRLGNEQALGTGSLSIRLNGSARTSLESLDSERSFSNALILNSGQGNNDIGLYTFSGEYDLSFTGSALLSRSADIEITQGRTLTLCNVSGRDLTKSGPGTLNLVGNLNFGNATVSEGTLCLNGTLDFQSTPSLSITDTGILSGSANILRTTHFNQGASGSGMLSPGDPNENSGVGTITIGSSSYPRSLLLADKTQLSIDAKSATEFDQIQLYGDLTLDGNLALNDLGLTGEHSLKIITYSGSLIDNGLNISSLPPGWTAELDTSIMGEVWVHLKVPPKQIFGHYMGCFPVGRGAIAYHKRKNAEKFRHDSSEREIAMGDRYKRWPLVPPDVELTRLESADLEIKRALRSGLNGFAVDAWAGGDEAKLTLDALFAAAEAADYPFHLTICLDPSCLEPGVDGYADAINYLLENHGDSPKLARRKGLPLIFGYSSKGLVASESALNPMDSTTKWEALMQRYSELRLAINEPVFLHFGMEHFFVGVYLPNISLTAEEANVQVAELLGQNFDAVGLFLDHDHVDWTGELSDAVRMGGAEWAPPIWIQYDNHLGSLHAPEGTQILRDGWQRAREQNATLIQFATWNDYGEHTSLAPTDGTGYGFGILNKYFADWWRTGQEPTPSDHDMVFLSYRKYPLGSKTYPFQQYRSSSDGLEVITILPEAATVRLPGRELDGSPIAYEAPAGFYRMQFPLTPGPVSVEIVRNQTVDTSLTGAEPITNLPFREDNVLVCVSTEDLSSWEDDFPGIPYPTDSEYGDEDGDGLPNWFEQYWFGDWGAPGSLDSTTPSVDPDNDGITNLDEYISQSDPTQPPPTYATGYVWDLFDIHTRGVSFNPDRDNVGTETWYYLWRPAGASDLQSLTCTTYNSISSMAHRQEGASLYWRTPSGLPEFVLRGRYNIDVALAWESPVDGNIKVTWEIDGVETQDGISASLWHSGTPTPLWSESLNAGANIEGDVTLSVSKGDCILLIESAVPGQDAYEAMPLKEFTVELLP